MILKDLDVNATYFVLLDKLRGGTWHECKLLPYDFDGYEYKIYVVPNDMHEVKYPFYTDSILAELEKRRNIIKKDSDNFRIKHISWNEQIYNNAYVHHEANIIVSESEAYT